MSLSDACRDFNVHIALTVHDACNYLAILTTTFVELYQVSLPIDQLPSYKTLL